MGKLSKKYIGQNQVGASELQLENNAALRSLNDVGASTDLIIYNELNELHILQPVTVPLATAAKHAVRKEQVDTEIAALNSLIGGMSSNFIFKYGVKAITASAALASITEATALAALLPFSDDQGGAGEQLEESDFVAGDLIALNDGPTSKLYRVVDVGGALYVTDEQAPVLANGNGLLIEHDLLQPTHAEETTSIYSFFDGFQRIGTVNWNFAKGIKFSADYGLSESFGILANDNIEQVIRKIETVYATFRAEHASDVASLVNSIEVEEQAREAADTALQTALDAEVLARQTLAGRVTDAEGEIDALQQSLSTAEGKIVDLENAVEALQQSSTVFEIGSKTLDATDIANGYIDLNAKYVAKSIRAGVNDRVNLYNGHDYTLTIEGAVTRLTFAGPSAAGQPEALEVGQTIFYGGAVAA